MITTIAYDVTVSSWLSYALTSMLAGPVFALLILCVATAALFFIVGKLWGLAWNKEWKFSGNTGIQVFVISLLAGFCLSAVNGLYGGKFFEVETAKAISVVSNNPMAADEFVKNEDTKAAVSIVKGMQKYAAEDEDEAAAAAASDVILVTIDENLASSYFSALVLLWSIFGALVALLIFLVARGSYKDIAEN